MKLTRKLGVAAVMVVIAGTTVALISAGPASARGGAGGGGGGAAGGGGGGGGRASVLSVIDSCGGTIDLKERVAGTLTVDISEFGGPSEVWTLQATQQEYDVTTGGRVGAPISLVPDTMLPLAFSTADGGFTTTADIADTPNMTHGFSYVATRTSPSPVSCAGVAYWTDHDGTTIPDPLNPTSKPDTAPVPTGTNAAHNGTNVVTLGFDQEMLATALGTPAVSRFGVTVNGVSRSVVGVNVTDDNPPNRATVALTLAGTALPANGTVTVQYRQSLFQATPQLQDMDSLMAPNFGPVAIPVS